MGNQPKPLETYPDLISYFYSTASDADTFTGDASAAGYMNPNRIAKEYLPLFVEHNRRFFRETDMTIAPMVLDRDQPSPAVKDAFAQFAPDGFATIVMYSEPGGKGPEPHVWKGMPVTELINNACNSSVPAQAADAMSKAITARGQKQPGFYFFRIVWVNPTTIVDAVSLTAPQSAGSRHRGGRSEHVLHPLQRAHGKGQRALNRLFLPCPAFVAARSFSTNAARSPDSGISKCIGCSVAGWMNPNSTAQSANRGRRCGRVCRAGTADADTPCRHTAGGRSRPDGCGFGACGPSPGGIPPACNRQVARQAERG